MPHQNSEYAKTEQRFAKLKQTFDKLIEQNSYKKLRSQIEMLKEQKKELHGKVRELQTACEAQLRIIKTLEDDKDKAPKE